MRIKSLYFKLLFSFLGVLFVTLILILALFVLTAGRSFKHEIERQAFAKLMIFKQTVEEKLDQKNGLPPAENREINAFLMTFAQLFDVTIWVTDGSGNAVIQTSQIPEKIVPKRGVKKDAVQGDIHLYHLSRRHLAYYAKMKVLHPTGKYTVHVYLNKEHERKPEVFFFLGLLIIGGVVALLIIPLTRIITRRLKALNDTALALAGGNLDRRAQIKGHDEIAKLGATFNLMAEKISRMIRANKSLMANVSHELRSPLARIRVSMELIADRLGPDRNSRITRYIGRIDDDIDTLDGLIDQILKLSKMDYQESVGSVRQIELDPFLAAAQKKYGPILQHKQLELVCEVAPGLYINADEQELTTIFSNLLDNAVKYTDAGKTIHVKAYQDESGCTVLTITNPYRRLRPEELSRLFDPFSRLEKDEHSGSGLGLTIVKRLVRKNRGAITALSTNKGLMFELTFN